uniref:Uncharacterized protein n=1 Tax=Calcidiscus leptoporus TaxID=127549 RepID=A0A7S0NWX1_9EUKA|mmetsp:Transcript_31298/g.72822  ORF Transcript_31298/g.72822 Transcript_31298/m.72822 type:complete len:221 (+) Transcript_31298:283-945(+)
MGWRLGASTGGGDGAHFATAAAFFALSAATISLNLATHSARLFPGTISAMRSQRSGTAEPTLESATSSAFCCSFVHAAAAAAELRTALSLAEDGADDVQRAEVLGALSFCCLRQGGADDVSDAVGYARASLAAAAQAYGGRQPEQLTNLAVALAIHANQIEEGLEPRAEAIALLEEAVAAAEAASEPQQKERAVFALSQLRPDGQAAAEASLDEPPPPPQ